MSVLGDACRLLAELSPDVPSDARLRMELVFEDAGATWNRNGNRLTVSWPNGEPETDDDADDDDDWGDDDPGWDCAVEDCECTCHAKES